MMIYLRNMVGFKLDYFKGMSYDDIRPIFEKYCNSNVAFLEKTKEQLEEEKSRALKRTSESIEEKAAKKQKVEEESEVSLELLSFGVDAAKDFKENMLRDYCWLKTYCCQVKLMLLDDAADIKLRLLEQSAAIVQIVSVVQIVKTASIGVNTVMYKLRLQLGFPYSIKGSLRQSLRLVMLPLLCARAGGVQKMRFLGQDGFEATELMRARATCGHECNSESLPMR
nr:hypothetical protein [Tanacetum cinerariifolium]